VTQAQDDPDKAGSEGSLDDELSSLEEDDFPDLVPADELSGLMDELDFLQDAGQVELASRYRQDIGLSPSAITVLTREDIQTSGASTVTDLLRLVPGLEVVDMAPFLLSLTGRLVWNYESNSHQVLLDGRETNFEVLGFTVWTMLPVFLDDIERIEVIRGPGSALYGANALAGVISITTRPVGEKTSGSVFFEGGEAGLTSLGAKGTARVGALGISAVAGIDMMNRWGSDPRTAGRENFKSHARLDYRLSDDQQLILDLEGAFGQGILPSTAGNLRTDLLILTTMASYRGPDVRARMHWTHGIVDGAMTAPLEYAGVTLARITPNYINGDTVDGELQWTLPRLLEDLMIIAGGGGRFSWVSSDSLLDEETFSDISSSKYHQAGFDYQELRGGAFVHAEYKPADWVTAVASLRFDYSSETGEELNPRLATVFQPLAGQFLRLGAARSFRKPGFWERRLHPDVSFPAGGPFAGNAENDFREFMTRVVGNPHLQNEWVVSFEAGYLGRFLDDALTVTLDLYYSLFRDEIQITTRIVDHPQWLVDLERSSVKFENMDRGLDVLGSEFSVRYDLSREVSLLASWTHRETFNAETGQCLDASPKNLMTLGGRFTTGWGMLGSLYLHSRSEFWDRFVDNPDGLMEDLIHQHMPSIVLVLARLGYRWQTGGFDRMEAGIKMFLPVSPFSEPHFRFRERGGGVTPFGTKYGGDELTRILTVYFKGSF
jgi:outer membrane receptor for ferrienterochelin and colicin